MHKVVNMNDDVRLLKILRSFGNKIDEGNHAGWTPLHFACNFNKKLDMI